MLDSILFHAKRTAKRSTVKGKAKIVARVELLAGSTVWSRIQLAR
jgi:hypothetical protein